MNKAKKIYCDEKGNMLKSLAGKNKDKTMKVDIEPNTVLHNKHLKLVYIGWQNSGVTLWFEDEFGKCYPMTDSVLAEYIHKNPIDFGRRNIEFLQQGGVYSIGFVDMVEK